ncbi:hypothetical protein K1719_001770 [Acacia pycnantha]|nr:hypothetical protein K1719_001770 [Acacia pycnantha]
MQLVEVQTLPPAGVMWNCPIIYSSNGLLCVVCKDSYHPFRLWNPAIREVRLVPWVEKNKRWSKKIGFGFSSIVNDYKIVIIGGYHLRNDLNNEVEVYSLSTGLWKEVKCGNLDGVDIQLRGESINEAIYWFGVKLNVENGNRLCLLVSYDIATEVFTLMPLPILAPPYQDSCSNRLTVHENKLALLSDSAIGDHESSLINLWVMEENTGVSMERWSWTKKYSISHPYSLLPGTIWRNEIVCHFVAPRHISAAAPPTVKNGERNIVMVNPTTNESKRVSIHKYGFGYDVLNYVESLVPVGIKYKYIPKRQKRNDI